LGLPDKSRKKKAVRRAQRKKNGKKKGSCRVRKKTRRTKGCEKLYPKTKLFKEKKVSAAALLHQALSKLLLS